MANGNVYAPLYNSVQARGRLSPLGAPGAVRPYEKKKGLGEKAAGALGAMIAEGLASDDKPSKLELIAKARLRDKELRTQLINQQSRQVPYVATRADLGMKDYSGMQDHLPPSQRTSTPAQYIGDEVIINSAFPARAGPGPSLLEQEWFNNRAYLMNLMGEGGVRNTRQFNPDWLDTDPKSDTYNQVIRDKRRTETPNMGGELIYDDWSAPAGFDDFTEDGSVARKDVIADFIQRVLKTKD